MRGSQTLTVHDIELEVTRGMVLLFLICFRLAFGSRMRIDLDPMTCCLKTFIR